MFANSDPRMISIFLKLFRRTFRIVDEKLHCKVQHRFDQDSYALQQYWSQLTAIPLSRFYSSSADKRSAGKPTLKLDYKGVCVLSYYSAEIARELCQIPKLIF